MSKKVVNSNYRVIVYPTPPGVYPGLGVISGIDWEPGEEKKACKCIAREIKRHVDRVCATFVECDVETICEFCDRDWEEDSDGSPMCCRKAYKEWLAKQEVSE